MQAILGPFISLGVNQSFFVMLGMFLITFLVVKFLALGRLSSTLIERDARIEGRRHQVHKLHLEYQDIQGKLEAQMKTARQEAGVVFNQLKEKAANEQRSIVNAARETAGREIKNVRSSVAEKTQEELKKLETEIPAIAKLIVDQILDGKSARRSSKDGGQITPEV